MGIEWLNPMAATFKVGRPFPLQPKLPEFSIVVK